MQLKLSTSVLLEHLLCTDIGKIICMPSLSEMFSYKFWLLAGMKREFSSTVWVAGPICRAAADPSEKSH